MRAPSSTLKSYNRSQMQIASSTRIPDGFIAAMPLLKEKPHQGLPSSNPAQYQAFNVSNSTVAIGLRAGLHLKRVRSRYTGKERDAESGNDYFGARYYSSAMGRFMSPDWSAKAEPVPYAKLDNPQSLNLYSYVLNNPLSRIDADGHSYLVYDDNTHAITLYSKDGNEIGHWDAHNNVAIHNDEGGYTKGPVQDGTYDVRDSDASGNGWGHAGENSYGKDGIAHVDDMVGATGETMDGAGVHSGRDDDTAHVTFGCVRTTDDGMDQVKATAKTDKLTTLEVKNNKANGVAWLKDKAAAEKAAAAAKAKKENQ